MDADAPEHRRVHAHLSQDRSAGGVRRGSYSYLNRQQKHKQATILERSNQPAFASLRLMNEIFRFGLFS
jgi:hypothetical protein